MVVFTSSRMRIRQTAILANCKRKYSGKRKMALEGTVGIEMSDEPVMKSFDTLVAKTTRTAIADDRQIKQVISRIVPAKTMAHIEFCRVEGGRMRLTVDSAAWISRIRFIESQIIDALRSNNIDSHTISYHVSPETTPVMRKTVRLAERTPSAAAAMEAAAMAVTDETVEDDKLRQELLKLARTLREDNS